MRHKIRQLLYYGTNLKPVFDPMEVPEELNKPVVLDLTLDVTNTTKIYHPNTEAVRGLISKADAIVCSTHAQSILARKYCPATTPVLVAPFGFSSSGKDQDSGKFTVGIFNNEPDEGLNNAAASSRKILGKLEYSCLVYGEPLDSVDEEAQIVTDDLEMFVSRIDVLLLPSLRNSINDITLPLSAMMAETVVVATNSGGYSQLNAAPGVFYIDGNTQRHWKKFLGNLEKEPRKLETLKRLNANFARGVSKESLELIKKLEYKLTP